MKAEPQNTTDAPALGPFACAVLVVRELAPVVSAYEDYLQLAVSQRFALSPTLATGLGLNALRGNAAAMLAGSTGRQWLIVVESSDAPDRDALTSHGWLAQEVLVSDVDAVAAAFVDSPFSVLRPPANLDVSDKIRACQVRGPAGEILYLTQVTGDVPPFDLPLCEGAVDHLFIAVLSTPDREATLAQYERFAGFTGLRFETRISVVNQALGLPLEQRHPVATLQLSGKALIEMDQIAAALPPPSDLCTGTAAVAIHASGVHPEGAVAIEAGPFAGQWILPHRGIAGERTALLFDA